MTRNLKTWPAYFDAVFEGRKNFEIRRNDRDYQVGDVLHLEKYDPDSGEYDGSYLNSRVTYIVHGPQFGILEGFCVMGIEPEDHAPRS